MTSSQYGVVNKVLALAMCFLFFCFFLTRHLTVALSVIDLARIIPNVSQEDFLQP